MRIKDITGVFFCFLFSQVGILSELMKKSSLILAPLIALVFAAIQAPAQSVNFNFTDNTSDGWLLGGFSSPPTGTPASVSTISGQNYIFIPIGGFQVANVSSGANGSDFYNAMQAAAINPNGYTLSYNWRVDTSTFGANSGTFLQIGTFVNTGSGYYAQHTSEVQLNGTQLASGQVFSGTVTENVGASGFAMPAADTFFRLGLIENGDGTSPVGVYFTDISVSPVPEPSSLSLFILGVVPAFWMMRRRGLANR